VEFLGGKGQKKEDADDWSDIGVTSDSDDIPF
jgi:hypothetical protein